jgi:hypothetical protein
MRLPLIFLAVLFAAGPLLAGEAPVETPAAPPGKWTFSTEATAGYSFATGGRTDGKHVNEQRSHADFVLTSQYNEGVPIRFGVSWDRFSFSSTAGTRLPKTLQAVNLIAGFDGQIGESIFFRVEAQPGWYSGSSRVLGDAFNVPIVIGASYLVSKDLQIALGVSIDPQRQTTVLPGGGIRWQINDKWLANFMLPKPRLEYKVSDDLTFFVGGDLYETTFRVDDEFGRRTHGHKLDGAWLDYFEARVGAGANVKATEVLDIDFELGYLVYREADFQRRDVTVHSESGGLYGGVSLRAKF